jgi:hypothetical protein
VADKVESKMTWFTDAVGSSRDVGVFVFEERVLIMASSKKR